MSTKKIVAIAAVWFAVGLGVATAVHEAEAPKQPSCPTEDSCYPDYHDGHWTIVEGSR